MKTLREKYIHEILKTEAISGSFRDTQGSSIDLTLSFPGRGGHPSTLQWFTSSIVQIGRSSTRTDFGSRKVIRQTPDISQKKNISRVEKRTQFFYDGLSRTSEMRRTV